MTNERVTSETPSKRNEPDNPARSPIGGDLFIGIGMLIFAIATFGITMTFDRVPRALVRGVQPAEYPRFLLYALGVLAVLLAYQGWKKGTGPAVSRPPTLTFYTAGALVLTAFSVAYLGVFASLVIFCAVLPPLWGQRNPIIGAAYAIGFPLIVYVLFSQVLGVRFPVAAVLNIF